MISGYVGLTFDDGPHPVTTEPLLACLRAAGWRATFFDIGARVARRPGLVRDRVDAGMWHGNHSFSHPRLPELGLPVIYREIERAQRAIRRATGEPPRLFRPPFGARDHRTAGLVQRLGLTEVLWTVDALDWSGVDAARIVSVAATVRPGGIILLHEGVPATVAAVPVILADLAARGLRPGAIDPHTGKVVAPD